MSTKTIPRARRIEPDPETVVDISGQIVELPIHKIDPHPQNPGKSRITPERVAALAQSIEAEGQLQAVRVRPRRQGNQLRYQLIFGETRFLAMKLLNRETIEARIQDLDDAATLRAMAVENGQRTNLDPIAVAQHLFDMTNPHADGSTPATQAEAGQCYGITQAEVSNRIRLLRLPQCWRDSIARGEISIKSARALATYGRAQMLLEAMHAEFARDLADGGFELEQWNADNISQQIAYLVRHLTRPGDKKTTHHHGYPIGQRPALFDLEAFAEQLAIVELPFGKAKKAKRAQNAALWDELQKPLLPMKRAPGEATAAKSRKASPAQEAAAEKARKAERKKKLGELAQRWVDRARRLEISKRINHKDGRAIITAALCAHYWSESRLSSQLTEAMTAALWAVDGERGGEAPGSGSWNRRIRAAAFFCPHLTENTVGGVMFSDRAARWQAKFAAITLWPVLSLCGPRGKWKNWIGEEVPAFGEDLPPIPTSEVEQLADLWHVTERAAWDAGRAPGTPEAELVAQWLAALRKAELEPIARSAGLQPAATAKATAAQLLEHHVSNGLEMPPELGGGPLRAKKKVKASRKK